MRFEQLREATGCCNRDIASSINELWKHGLVEFRACENYNQHRAREYRLTFVSTVSGDFIKPATNDYLSWVPAKVDGIDQKKLGDKAQPAKPPAGDKAQPAPQYAGDKVQPAQKPKRRKTAENAIVTPQAAGDTTLPHIYIPYPPGQSNGPKGDDGYHNQPEIPVGDFDAMLRERLAAYWTGANRSDRKRLAESIRLPVDELASFANGGHLPHLKAAPLMCELARTAA